MLFERCWKERNLSLYVGEEKRKDPPKYFLIKKEGLFDQERDCLLNNLWLFSTDLLMGKYRKRKSMFWWKFEINLNVCQKKKATDWDLEII